MKNLLLNSFTLLFLLVGNSIKAQVHCGTIISEEAYDSAKALIVGSIPLPKADEIVKVRVFIACSGSNTTTAAATTSDVSDVTLPKFRTSS